MNDSREFIINEAYKLFLSRSYEAVTINDISKAIGLTKGALYHHFLNKEDLFKAVIDKYLIITGMGDIKKDITLAEYIKESINHADRLVQNFFIDDHQFVPVNYLSLLIDALRHYPGFADDNVHLFGKEIEKIKFVLDNAVRSGEIRKDIDTSVMALNFFSISLGIASNFFHKNSPSSAIDIFRLQIYEFYKVLKR